MKKDTKRTAPPEVHPVLLRKIKVVLAAMAVADMPMVVTPNPVRTAETQHALYQQGRTKPGKIVTNADGYKTKSNHQVKADGYGHAVDCHFVVNGIPTWDVPDAWWAAYGALCRAVGLRWGIRIGEWIDRPHAELAQQV